MNEKKKSFWEKQKNGQWKILTNPLKNDSEIHSEIDHLLTNFYWKFREKKNLPQGTYNPEIEFLGFKGFEDFPDRAGHCKTEIKWEELDGEKVEGSECTELSIELHQYYLLDRLGMDELIRDYQENEKGWKFSITFCDFNELIATIAHELAHACQTSINLRKDGKRSQCESTGDKDASGNLLYPKLAAEHTVLTNEIKQMIESSAEYQEFKKWWRGEKTKKNLLNQPSSWEKVKDSTKKTTDKIGDASAKATKKAGEGLEKAGKKLSQSADKDKWPQWVLPVGIVMGVLFLIGIIAWIFKPKK